MQESPDLEPLWTRLTRTEYRETMRMAWGIEVDVQTLPADGRVGPFTSNAEMQTDAVHPYLLMAEALARTLVPDGWPACAVDDVGECVENTYREPLEIMFRRPLSRAEMSVWASIIEDVVDAGGTPEEATRAMLSSVMVDPGFLFRTSVPMGAELPALRIAEHLSYAIWDAPPDVELRAAVSEGPILADAWMAQGVRLTQSDRLTATFARFLAQWLHLDTDVRMLDAGFETSPNYLELLAYVEREIHNDAPVLDLMRGRDGVAHRENRERYGLASVPEAAEIEDFTWPERTQRRGILSQELFASTTRHPDPSRRTIFRGAMFWDSLMCTPIQLPPAGFVDLDQEVASRMEDSRCSGCHRLIEPVGGLFTVLDEDTAVTIDAVDFQAPSELVGTYESLPQLFDAVAHSSVFAECFARHWLAFFLERAPEDVDDAWVADLGRVVAAGASMSTVVEETILAFVTRTTNMTPWCEGA